MIAENGIRRELMGTSHEDILQLINAKAENLYLARRMLCAEAVLVTLNHTFKAGLSEEQAVSLAAPFCVGIGDSGCLCGALSGGVLSLGLILGANNPYHYRKKIRSTSRDLHNRFRDRFGSTCCRVISKTIKHDSKAHFIQCAGLTAETAGLTAEILLSIKPDLVSNIDQAFLHKRDTKIGGIARTLVQRAQF